MRGRACVGVCACVRVPLLVFACVCVYVRVCACVRCVSVYVSVVLIRMLGYGRLCFASLGDATDCAVHPVVLTRMDRMINKRNVFIIWPSIQ